MSALVQLTGDLRAEAEALRELIARRDPDPQAVTPFKGWRVRDCIGHVVFIDRMAHLTLTDEPAFDAALAEFGAGTKAVSDLAEDDSYGRLRAYQIQRLGHLSFDQLLAAWDVGLAALCDAAARRSEDDKVKWFGPPMAVPTLVRARQMETWGYGQDVFDLLRERRKETGRLRNVADFAVRTFGFTFAIRNLPPAERPYMALTAPTGETWTWNEPSNINRIEGPAVDFCLVATQRRNVADTALRTVGETAATWMRIAQCIAGGPHDGPAPGERAW